MAEKKPMSLNERHQRFLASQNRSARPSSTLTGEKTNPHLQNSNLEGRRRLFKPSSNDFVNQNEPNFSGIMDFDSPPPLKSNNVSDDAPSFKGIMDFDSPPPLKSNNVSDDAPSFKGIMDFDSPPAVVEEETSCSESVDCDDSSAVDSKDSKKNSSSKVVEEKFSEYESGLEDSDTYTEEDIGGDDDEDNQKLADGSDDDSSPTNVSSLGQEVVSQSEKDENEDEDESYVYRFKSSAVDSKGLKKNSSSKVVEEKFSEAESGFEDSDTYMEEDIGGDEENNQKLADGSDDDSLPTNAPSLGQEFVSQSGNLKDGNEDDSYVYRFKSSRTPEEEKPQKVKLEGRRRLCKASVKEDRADCRVEVDQHEYLEIADFSPPSRNVYIAPDKPGVSGVVELDTPPEKIRDILDDLSSKLEFMSIEKKPNKRVVKVPDSALSKLMEHYDSPGSSSPLSPDPSVISPDVSVKPWTQGAIKEVESDKFFDAVDYVKEEVDEVHKIEKKDYGVTKSVKEHGVTKSEKKDYGFLKSEKKDCGFLKSEKKDYGVIKSEKKAYSVKKIEKSVSKDKYLVVSDDDEDPYTVLSSTNRQSSSRVYLPKEHDTICVDTPKQLGGGDWVFEDGESIILTGKRSNYTLPGKIAKMLYPHQRQGLRWLWSLHCKGTGGILGDDMGLGKTMQMCSFIAGLFHSRLIKRVLVVAPKTLLSHWIKELTVVGLSAKIREYYGSCAKARQYELQYIFQDSGILLTTYDIVRNNYKSLRGDSFFLDEAGEDCITWDYTILDEGHIIKNPSTQRAKSLLEIPCCHRIIISGTPIQNNLKELWALFSFCCPELLGDKKEFKLKYESAILRLNDKNATDREKRIGSTVAKDLRERIEPYFLRRLKSEVFLEEDSTKTSKISKKHELIVWLKLTQCQRQLYEAFLNSELVLSSFDKSPLAAITILKKICDHPYLLTKRAAEEVLEGMETMVNQEELGILEKMAHQLANATDREHFQDLIDNVSCKIAFMLPLLDNLILEGHHVLIFSQTRKMLNFVQEAVISKGYNFLRIDGTTKMSDREKIVKDFQEGKGAPIFLLTSAVGGLGLTLTKADRVIVVDPAWNPSTDNQSVDRAYRIGQMKDVIVYRLMTCGTIEEKIYKMQVFKGGLFKTATENKEQTKYFSQRDLRELFSLPKEGFDVSVTQRQLEEEHGQHHTMSDSLKEEIEFLESHDIGGVSHHSLLYSKTAPAPEPVPEENEVIRRKEYTDVGGPSSVRNVERNVDGAEFAFNPKEVKTVSSKNTSSVTPNKLSESEIRDRIERLNQMYGNKAMISRLPDKGEKLKRQIADLSKELEQINMVESSEIIDLDELSGKLQRVHV